MLRPRSSSTGESRLALLLFTTLAGAGVPLFAAADDGVVDDDWTQLARLSLANYALSKAAGAPTDVFCATRGTKENGCHCWNAQGNPTTNGGDCNSPITCLIYTTQDDGNLYVAKLNTSDEVNKTLSSWSVPPDMVTGFDLALLTENATFTTFDFVLNPATAHYEAHVGTARLHQGQRFIGYTYGKSDGDLVQPYIRTVKAGDCHGTMRGQHPRGYRTDELNRIREGLGSTAFKTAASKAAPTAPPRAEKKRADVYV